jgi:hypothetical protein
MEQTGERREKATRTTRNVACLPHENGLDTLQWLQVYENMAQNVESLAINLLK